MPYAKKLRTFALVAAALLLLGTASASGAGKIGGNQIKQNAIASKHIKKNAVQSSDIKSNAVQSGEIKNNTVKAATSRTAMSRPVTSRTGPSATGDLANGSVTADKIAPGAVSFQSGLWSTLLRNQTGAAVSGVQTGPAGQPDGRREPEACHVRVDRPGRLRKLARVPGHPARPDHETSATGRSTTSTRPVRPSLRIEINPHFVDDATLGGGFEFTTLTHQPAPGATGWLTHEDAHLDTAWHLTGDEVQRLAATQAPNAPSLRSSRLLAVHDDLTRHARYQHGHLFGLGSGGTAPTETPSMRSCSTATCSTSNRRECS